VPIAEAARFFFGGLRSPQKRSPEVAFERFLNKKTNKKHNRDEYFGGKRNSQPRSIGGRKWYFMDRNLSKDLFGNSHRIFALPTFLVQELHNFYHTYGANLPRLLLDQSCNTAL
jgi:hypothetical protein